MAVIGVDYRGEIGETNSSGLFWYRLKGTSEDDFMTSNGTYPADDADHGLVFLGEGGNDTIDNAHPKSTIYGGDGNDSIINYADNVTIDAGDGDDCIYNTGRIQIYGDISTISIGNNVSINAGNGNDYISNDGGKDISINADEGNDTIENNGSGVTIDGGAGNDYIYNYKDENSILGGAGNDYIYLGGASNTVNGGAGNDKFDLYLNGEDNVIEYAAGEGNDTINVVASTHFSGSNFTIKLTKGTLGSASVNASGDTVLKVGSNTLTLQNINGEKITIVDSKKSSVIGSEREFVEVTEDGQEISSSVGSYFENESYSDVKITGSNANDGIENFGESALINSGKGCDVISNSGNFSTIDAGDGNDKIENSGEEVSIDGGAGNDDITNYGGSGVTINGGDDNDDISNAGGKEVSISGGDGNDMINNFVSLVSLDSGEEILTPDNTTIDGGDGNDFILNEDGENVLFVHSGGNDTIEGFNESSTLQIGDGSGTYCTQYSGDDLILTTEFGSVTLIDMAGASAINIEGEEVPGYWTLNGNKAIYTLDDKALVTVTGVTSASGLSCNTEDKTVTVSKAALGTSQVSISNGYTLALADGLAPVEDTPKWTISNGNASLKSATSAGYELKSNKITYKAANLNGAVIATVSGLNTKLKAVDGEIEGLEVYADDDDKTIKITDSNVLNNKTVTLNSQKGYTLDIDVDVVEEPELDTPAWSVSSTTATLKEKWTAGYTLDGNKLTYTAAKTGDTLATVKGLKSGLIVKADGTIDGITFDEVNITLSKGVLGTTAVTLDSEEFTLALDDDVKQVAESAYVWSVSGSNATYTRKTPAYYTLNDDLNAVTYIKEESKPLATLSNLKSGLKPDAEGNIAGITVSDNNTITLSANVLNNKSVTVTDKSDISYTLAIGEGITPSEPLDPTWSVKGTTATFSQTIPQGYSMSANGKTINYASKNTPSTLATVSGLKSGLTASNGTINGVTVSGNTITLSADVLGTSKVSVSGNYGYKLALDEEIPTESKDADILVVNGSTVTYKDGKTAYYVCDDKSVTYKPAVQGKTTYFTLSNLKSGLKVNADGTIDGIGFDEENKTITLTSSVLNGKTVTLTGKGYKLAAGDGVHEPKEGIAWSVSGTTATLKSGMSAGYTLDSNKLTYKAAKTTNLTTVSGLKSGLTVNDDGTIDGLDFDTENKTVTISGDVLNNNKVTVSNGYKLEIGENIPTVGISEEKWSVSGTTATFKGVATDGYSLSTDGKTLNYIKANDKATLATVSGLKSGLTVDKLNAGVTVEGNTITLSADVLGTSKVSVSGNYGYTLALDGVPTTAENTKIWSVSGTTATLKDGTAAYYTCNGTAVTYTAAKQTGKNALLTISGLKSGLKPDASGEKIAGIEISGDGTVTVSNSVLNKGKVTLTGEGYTLALGDDVTNVATTDDHLKWSGNDGKSTTRKLVQTTHKGYTCDGKTINYYSKDSDVTFASISGADKNSTFNADNFSEENKTITLTAGNLSNKVTIGGTYSFFFAEGDYKKSGKASSIKGSAAVDNITFNGSNVSLNADAGDDVITIGGEKVTLNAGAGNDTISATGFGVSLNADAGDDVITIGGNNATVLAGAGNDKITVSGANAVVNAGAGNDTLWGNANVDTTFIYAKTDGKDVINGFDSGDTLTLSGITFKESMATYSNGNVVITVNGKNNTVTLNNIDADTSLNINGNTYGISGTKLVKK